jgi:hypothetical protein
MEEIKQDKSKRLPPFAWQAKEVLRKIQKEISGSTRAKAMAYYLAITWIASDFTGHEKEVTNWTGLIVEKSGLKRPTVYKMHKIMAKLGIIKETVVGKGKGGHNKIIVELLR